MKNNTEVKDKKVAGTVKAGPKKEGKASDEHQFETFVVHSAKYQTLLTKKYKNRKKWEPKNEKLIVSFIPGTILKIFVKDKEKVQKDQPLLMLEAMKMENTMFSPFSGTIKKVYAKVGDRVPKGFLIIEFN